ncbi:Oidioi.mRNA.OKI2018_I69.chr1.g709.t1.cds [Oikopleura dioica]|uniref:Oidioi.mRNA.OKI2018_I69.chr1.g709.t1.cds n=1 Tax=Oikopleura dioica TaxID=34765 RepID=A0ABN7SQ07_OIKDI|nr:Oidioi.mRNA.OKI2018_I69.chr1.g709.t1.cds [Oikopleura dioica]
MRPALLIFIFLHPGECVSPGAIAGGKTLYSLYQVIQESRKLFAGKNCDKSNIDYETKLIEYQFSDFIKKQKACEDKYGATICTCQSFDHIVRSLAADINNDYQEKCSFTWIRQHGTYSGYWWLKMRNPGACYQSRLEERNENVLINGQFPHTYYRWAAIKNDGRVVYLPSTRSVGMFTSSSELWTKRSYVPCMPNCEKCPPKIQRIKQKMRDANTAILSCFSNLKPYD